MPNTSTRTKDKNNQITYIKSSKLHLTGSEADFQKLFNDPKYKKMINKTRFQVMKEAIRTQKVSGYDFDWLGGRTYLHTEAISLAIKYSLDITAPVKVKELWEREKIMKMQEEEGKEDSEQTEVVLKKQKLEFQGTENQALKEPSNLEKEFHEIKEKDLELEQKKSPWQDEERRLKNHIVILSQKVEDHESHIAELKEFNPFPACSTLKKKILEITAKMTSIFWPRKF